MAKKTAVRAEIPEYVSLLSDAGFEIATKEGVKKFCTVDRHYPTEQWEKADIRLFGEARDFTFSEVKSVMPDCSYWTVKIKFPGAVFKEFFPNYRIHFFLDPKPYESFLENKVAEINKPQKSLMADEEDIVRACLKERASYDKAVAAQGVRSFRCRLKEYKADEASSSDTITFIVGRELVDFAIQCGPEFHKLKLVINDATDPRYALVEVLPSIS